MRSGMQPDMPFQTLFARKRFDTVIERAVVSQSDHFGRPYKSFYQGRGVSVGRKGSGQGAHTTSVGTIC